MDPNDPSGGTRPGWVPPPDPSAPAPPGPWAYPQPAQPGAWGPAQPGAWGPPHQAWGAPAEKRKRFGWGAVIVAFVVGGIVSFVVTFGGLIVIGLALSTPDAIAATHPAPAEGADVVQVGDCLSKTPAFATVVDQSDVVDCDDAHDSEVAAVLQIPGGSRKPGDDELQKFIDEACRMAFHGYVGIEPDMSQYGSKAVVPSASAWADGDRSGFCLVNTVGQPAGRGTVRNSHD